MRIADYIIKKLTDYGVDTCFMVTGGGSLFLNDALFKNKKISKFFCHHEQSCAIAAESYYRSSLKPALVQVTTGPGSINALNGVYGAYVDSIPMFVLSGQVKLENLSSKFKGKLRQFGDQEVNIEKISKPITKYSVTIKTRKVDFIDKVINKALETFNSGRKGPVWIDVPIDIQGMYIDEKLIKKKKKSKINKKFDLKKKKIQINYLIKRLEASKRPVIICGNGVRFSGEYKNFRKFLNIIKIPSLTVWNSHDIIENKHECYSGRPGLDGERAGNFAIQNSDLLIIIGARMHVRQIGFNFKTFARSAFKIMIDIDKFEMNKKNLKIDYKINSDLKIFLPELIKKLKKIKYKQKISHKKYLYWCKNKLIKFPVFLKKFYKSKKGTVNPYNFLNYLFYYAKKKTIFITGDGTAAVVTFKVANIKEGQRLFTNKGCASMGYDLPALFGSIIAENKKNKKNKAQHICITGDGSIMMNLQELQTLSSIKENFIIFILNNDGYHSIRQTQKNFFNTEIGCGPKSGLTFPDFKKISNAFNFNYFSIKKNQDLLKLDKLLNLKKKIICEVFIDKSQFFEPRVVSYKNSLGKLFSPPLEDMSPRLSTRELEENMIIPIIKG
jgi:acetolactate synthase-1/2/3 large subunit